MYPVVRKVVPNEDSSFIGVRMTFSLVKGMLTVTTLMAAVAVVFWYATPTQRHNPSISKITPSTTDATMPAGLTKKPPAPRDERGSAPPALEDHVSPAPAHQPSELRLRGTVVSQGSASFAVVEQTGGEALIEEGAEVAPGTMIADIQLGRIILKRGDQQETILVARDASPAPPADKTADRVTEQEVYLDEVPLTWNRPGKLNTQIRLIPAYQGGEPAGVKVLALHPKSLFARSGLQSGDWVQRLNGKAIHEPQQLIASWQGVESQASLTVNLIRNGKEMTIQARFH